MRIKVFLAILLAVLLAGCATGRKKQVDQLQELQSRIDFLEAKLQKKNREAVLLENELDDVRETVASLRKQTSAGIDSNASQLTDLDVQIALKNASFFKGALDGRIGPQTREAIKAFQKANGLKPDGVVGGKTISKLKKYLKR